MFKLDLHVYEMAARVLFYIVHWLRSIKEFQTIHVKDQVRYTRFVLSFRSLTVDRSDHSSSSLLASDLSPLAVRVQVRSALDESDSLRYGLFARAKLYTTVSSLMHSLVDQSNGIGMKHLHVMQDIYNRIQQLNMNYVEYFHLKILLLYQSSECQGLNADCSIEASGSC